MQIINITPTLRATRYDTGEMSLRGMGENGQLELLVWSRSILKIRDYALLFLDGKELPEIKFGLDPKSAT